MTQDDQGPHQGRRKVRAQRAHEEGGFRADRAREAQARATSTIGKKDGDGRARTGRERTVASGHEKVSRAPTRARARGMTPGRTRKASAR